MLTYRLASKELQTKVAENYKLSGWFNQPMPGFPNHQNKIWKWDFAPKNDRSATRKGWRLFARVEDPSAPEPVPATAFHVYEKPGPTGNPAHYLAEVLKKFLKATIEVKTEEERFRRQYDGDKIISLCLSCFDMVANTSDEQEADIAEDTHQCI